MEKMNHMKMTALSLILISIIAIGFCACSNEIDYDTQDMTFAQRKRTRSEPPANNGSWYVEGKNDRWYQIKINDTICSLDVGYKWTTGKIHPTIESHMSPMADSWSMKWKPGKIYKSLYNWENGEKIGDSLQISNITVNNVYIDWVPGSIIPTSSTASIEIDVDYSITFAKCWFDSTVQKYELLDPIDFSHKETVHLSNLDFFYQDGN